MLFNLVTTTLLLLFGAGGSGYLLDLVDGNGLVCDGTVVASPGLGVNNSFLSLEDAIEVLAASKDDLMICLDGGTYGPHTLSLSVPLKRLHIKGAQGGGNVVLNDYDISVNVSTLDYLALSDMTILDQTIIGEQDTHFTLLLSQITFTGSNSTSYSAHQIIINDSISHSISATFILTSDGSAPSSSLQLERLKWSGSSGGSTDSSSSNIIYVNFPDVIIKNSEFKDSVVSSAGGALLSFVSPLSTLLMSNVIFSHNYWTGSSLINIPYSAGNITINSLQLSCNQQIIPTGNLTLPIFSSTQSSIFISDLIILECPLTCPPSLILSSPPFPCQPCPTYSIPINLTTCSSCPPGSYITSIHTNLTNITSCTPCPPNSFSRIANHTCSLCPIFSAQNTVGKTSCICFDLDLLNLTVDDQTYLLCLYFLVGTVIGVILVIGSIGVVIFRKCKKRNTLAYGPIGNWAS